MEGGLGASLLVLYLGLYSRWNATSFALFEAYDLCRRNISIVLKAQKPTFWSRNKVQSLQYVLVCYTTITHLQEQRRYCRSCSVRRAPSVAFTVLKCVQTRTSIGRFRQRIS